MIIIELEKRNRAYAEQLRNLSEFYCSIESPGYFYSDLGKMMQIGVCLKKSEQDRAIHIVGELLKNSEIIGLQPNQSGAESDANLLNEIDNYLKSGNEQEATKAIERLLQVNQPSSEEESVYTYIDETLTKTVTDDEIKRDQEFIKACHQEIVESVIKKGCPQELLPELIIGATYNKCNLFISARSEENSSDCYYIMYDCHISDLCDTLNRIYLEQYNNKPEITHWCHQILLENAIVVSDEIMQNYNLLRLAALGDMHWDDWVVKTAQLHTEGQELYMFGHEVGNWLYTIGHSGRLTGRMQQEILDQVDECKILLQDLFKDVNSLMERYPRIVEECYADSVAYKYVMEQPAYADIKIFMAKSLLLSLLNLEVLEIAAIGEEESIKFEDQVDVRIQFFCVYVKRYFRDKEKEYMRMYEATRREYTGKITRVAERCFWKLHKERQNIEKFLETSQS